MVHAATPHTASYTSRKRKKQGVPKLRWVYTSPDFKPIKCIWTLLKRRIQRRRASEKVTTVTDMKLALQEEWEKITVAEIHCEIDKLPSIVTRCLAVNGGDNFHALCSFQLYHVLLLSVTALAAFLSLYYSSFQIA